MTEHAEPGDRELAERARNGDTGALDVLVERSSRRLRSSIESRLGHRLRRRVSASDVLQEAHLAALGAIGTFEPRDDGSFHRWFREIVENKVTDQIRRHLVADRRGLQQEVTRPRRLPTEALAGNAPTPSAIAIGEEFKRSVANALDRLPESYREVLVHFRDQDVSLEDVAARMRRSPAAVRKLYGRALARLEELLDVEPRDGHERRRPTR